LADPLAVLWERADIPSPLVDGDEVLRWDGCALEQMVAAGLFRETSSASSVVCDACDYGHVEDVVFINTPADEGVRAYIWCPDSGRVRVPLDRLRQWEVDFQGMARLLAASLAQDGVSEELVPSRVWFIGKAVFAARSRDVFLARGLTWADGAAIVAQASRLTTSGAPLVLVTGAVPPTAVWGGSALPILPVSAVLSLRNGRATIDKLHIESALSGRGGQQRSPNDQVPRRRLNGRQAIRDEVSVEFADGADRHVVRINGFEVAGFSRSDLKFTRLLLIAAVRRSDPDVEGGGWLDKWRLLGDDHDHDLEELRSALEQCVHPDLCPAELKALLSGSGRRDGRIRLAVHPYRVAFDDSLASFQFLGEPQTERKKGSRRTKGARTHEAQMEQARHTAEKLLAEARKLNVLGPRQPGLQGRGE